MENSNKSLFRILGKRLWQKVNRYSTVFRRCCVSMLLLGILAFIVWDTDAGTWNVSRKNSLSPMMLISNYWQAQTISEQGSLFVSRYEPMASLGERQWSTATFLCLHTRLLTQNHKPFLLRCDTLSGSPVRARCLLDNRVRHVVDFSCPVLWSPHHDKRRCCCLQTFPGTIIRSSAGFSDRDAFVWMLAILAILIYLYKERMSSGDSENPGNRAFQFFRLHRWVELGSFRYICSDYNQRRTLEVLHNRCWISPKGILPLGIHVLAVVIHYQSPLFAVDTGFSTHIAALMLAPPLVLLALRWTRWLLLRFVPRWAYSRTAKSPWTLALVGIAAAGCYVLLQYNTFPKTALAFIESSLMKTVTELRDPIFQRLGHTDMEGCLQLAVSESLRWRYFCGKRQPFHLLPEWHSSAQPSSYENL